MMTDITVQPRQWQLNALQTFKGWRESRQSGDSRTFTTAVTGGAGKTHFGAMVESYLFSEDAENVVIICPSNTIAMQWIKTMAEHWTNLKLWSPDRILNDRGDFVLTYQMMNNHAGRINRLVDFRTLLIFDECHHLADSLSWGDAARLAGKDAGYRLMLTGTPFREDDARIPYVTYKDGLLVTNYEYTYGQALDDKHVRPVYIKALDAHSHWQLDDLTTNKRLLETGISHLDTSLALRSALNPDSKWFAEIVNMAHHQLMTIRKHIPDAGGIITCIDQEHARKVQRKLQKLTHCNPVLAISDDSDSDEKIEKFRDSNTEWLVVVRKGSEGLNIPRFHVGVCATNITKQLSFLQFLWRIVRVRDNQTNEKAHFFMPAHPELVSFASSIRDMRVHALSEEPVEPSAERASSDKTQSQLFTPIEADAGDITEMSYTNHPDDTLDLLIKIRELAAWSIDEYARHQAEISLNVALHDIRQILNIPVKQVEEKSQSPVDDYEYKRQWRSFLSLYDSVKNGKDWWRDVLSWMYPKNEGNNINATDIAHKLNMPETRLLNNWKRDIGDLVDTGLISTRIIARNRTYKNNIPSRLKEIAPDHNTEELVGYLLTGKLPEEPHA